MAALVPAAPKQFAALLGALMALGSLLVGVVGRTDHALALARALAGVLASLAALEAVAGFCLGCAIYRLMQRWGLFAPDRCVDCRREERSQG